MRGATAAATESRPLVAVICRVPIFGEAATAAVGDVMNVRSFPPSRDTSGLLSWLRPDGIVVDSDEEAAAAAPFAIAANVPLVQIQMSSSVLRVLRAGRWEKTETTASPEAVRNILVGGIFGKGRTP
jgi:hypothetical protein